MCQRTTCNRCEKATWAGCGKHIEQALAGVPPEQRCTCASEVIHAAAEQTFRAPRVADAGSAKPAAKGFMARIFGTRK